MVVPTFDVLVIGAGPAGCTAAILLAQKGRKVALVDAAKFPRDRMSAGWLNVRVAPLLATLGVPVRSILSQSFSDVVFHNADFTKTAKPSFKDAPGYLIDRTQFGDALVKAAVSQEVRLFDGQAVGQVKLQERSVTARLADQPEVSARLLLLAAGRGSPLLEQLGFAQPHRHGTIWTAQVDAVVKASKSKGDPRVAVVLGLDRAGSFGMCCLSHEHVAVSINWLGDKSQALGTLARVCQGLFEHKVAPVDLTAAAAGAALVASPASAALDMETHVGKNTLLIGDAGGFVSAASNEGIYPAMWSAQIAAEIVDSALRVPQSQDELMTFESRWRTTMADYLRSPNTDIQFLLPLIFSNQPMADRMGAAFFSGENI